MNSINVQDFKNILKNSKDDTSIVCINVCTPIEYAEKHIDGVINIPLNKIDKNLDSLKDKEVIYVHCISGQRAGQAIQKMKRLGISAKLVNLEGGLNAWQEAGFATRSLSPSAKLPLMRQVFLTAGLLVLLGVILSLVTKNQNYLFISAFVGLGLSLSGVTGWCGLQLLLAKMPWNKIAHKSCL